MAEPRPASRLSDLVLGSRRLAIVGLAKNTGKTEALTTILREHATAGRQVGVTSIGRDGEEHDVIDARISKPRVRLRSGSLVATSGALLRAGEAAHERLVRTGVRTPLGEVVIARMLEPGTVEVAGPSAAADVRAVSEAMRELGADQVLIDGAVDRRAASSPAVSDGLLMATGAVLGEQIEQVVAATSDAVELIKLPLAARPKAAGNGAGAEAGVLAVPRGLVLGGEPAEVAALLRAHPQARSLLVEGALGERFLDALLAARRERAGRVLSVLAGDPTKIFLTQHGPGWYERQGIQLRVRRGIELKAITVNPVAPQSHSFDSARLRELIGDAVGEVPVLDVRDRSYLAFAA
jgi:hypothetical protein